MHNLSVLGTSSDCGKSTLAFVIGRIIQERGYSVAPFKAQNVSNNANVADDGSEISVAQHFQALALGVPSSFHMNPVLLKSGRGNSTSLIVEGKVLETKNVRDYYRDLDILKPVVHRAFSFLDSKFDCVVAEGAGSPVELNLMDKDLANIYTAETFNNKIILVADIEKSGVFASIYGVASLLPEKLQKNLIGVIVNKFRGDMTLFDDGVRIIESEFGIPVLGVLPYEPLNLGFEDSQSLMNYSQSFSNTSAARVGVVAYPTMSNYNDLEPLIASNDVSVEFIRGNRNLDDFDEIILPGSKLVLRDLKWLKESGLFEQLRCTRKPITGICGGYQMLFRKLSDPQGVESAVPEEADGLAFIDDEILFLPEKILKRGRYSVFGREVDGFEMHHGISTEYPLEYDDGRIRGTFVHSLFDDEKFISYRTRRIAAFTELMKQHIDTERLFKALGID